MPGEKAIRRLAGNLQAIRPRARDPRDPEGAVLKKIRVGILGFGLAGRVFHSTLLKAHPGYEVTKVFSSRAQEVAEVFPDATATGDLQSVLSDDRIDLVVNCCPNRYHYDYSAAALEAGKHVVVEKPFVNTSVEGEKLIELAAKNKKCLTVFQNRRWDSDFLTVQKLIASGRLGEISLFESRFDRLRPTLRPERWPKRWREEAGPGSGVLYDLGAHLLDQALVAFGTPDAIQADIEIQRAGGTTDDYFHVVLKYAKKRVILRSSSFTDLTPRFHVQGSKGNFIKYSLDPQEDAMRNGLSPNDKGFGVEDESRWGRLTDSEGTEKIRSETGDYLAFYRNLHQHLTSEGCPVPVNPTQALEVIRWIEQAFAQNPLDESHF